MLKLNEKYYLDTDALNYILKEKSISKKGKNIGKYVYRNIGYYGKLEHLFASLVDIDLRDNIEILNNIKDVVNFKSEIRKMAQTINYQKK